MSTLRRIAWLAVAAVLLAGCGGQKRAAPDPAKHAQELIEAGNDAYKTGDYRLAAHRYAAAAVVKKDDPAAYYGLGMALAKLGRDEEARKAYARAKELATREP